MSSGCLLTFILLEIFLRLGGFAFLSLREIKNLRSVKDRGACRILCLGESTTQNQYPNALETILNERGIGVKFDVIDKGLAGINTKTILWQLEDNLDKYHPDIVITMMGNNDGGIMYYKDIPEMNSWLFRKVRLYRFLRLIYNEVFNTQKTFSGIKDGQTYEELGRLYRKQARFNEAEMVFKKAVESKPADSKMRTGLGIIYLRQNRILEAEKAFRKAIELEPGNQEAYENLCWVLLQRRPADVEEIKRTLEFAPQKDKIYMILSKAYQKMGMLTEAEMALKNAIQINPKNNEQWRDLAEIYFKQNRLFEAEAAAKSALECNPGDSNIYGQLAIVYGEMGNHELFKANREKASRLREEYYSSVTAANYLKIKKIVDKRNIRLICVQYPMLNTESLKKIFEGEPGVIFVDNEKTFKDAVGNEGFREYFLDMFAGDFGHCTPKGNGLLAKNIAEVVLKEVFKK
ncbi:MAG: tetratricopeptide repeat protein [Candidatus Omnitrophica bacterium]|nr:tetratricopeptide repeat protein [Candidatus Omnitrophota bacterium]